jgi:hypothetical protein
LFYSFNLCLIINSWFFSTKLIQLLSKKFKL